MKNATSNPIALTLVFSVFVSFFAASVAAECLFLEIASINDASVTRGVTARFPLSIKNTGSGDRLVSLGGSCPSEIDCSFDSSSATLAAGETKIFTLSAGTARASGAYYEIPVTVSAGGTAPCDERVARLSVTQPAPSPSASVEPSLGFDASLSPSGVVSSGRPGETLEYEILVSNANPAKGFAKIRLEGAFAGTTLLSAMNFDVAANSEKRVTAKVRLPPGTPGGTYETVFRVQATSNEGETQEFSLPANVFVFSDTVDVDLLNQPAECIQVKHEDDFAWPMELRNNGESRGPFTVAVDAPAAVKEFVGVTPSLLEIASGDQQPVTLSVKPSALVTVAAYQFNLIVKYLSYTVLSVPLCVNVSGVTGFTVEKESEYAVKRGVVTPLRITISNGGSVSDDYAVQPAIVSWLSAQAVPASFTLSPHESKTVSIVVSTTLEKTPLGTRFLPVVVRSLKTSASELHNLKLKISAAPQQGLSYLTVKKTRFTAPAGGRVDDEVEVLNSKSEALHGVTLTLLGIPSSWYSVSPATLDVAAKSAASFKISFAVPQSKAGKHAVTIYAESLEGEVASLNATLEAVAPQAAGFSSSLSDVDYSRFETQGEITVTVVLRNIGGTTLSGITPVAPEGFAFSNAGSPVALAPGEEKTVQLSLKPLGGSVSPETQLQLAFQSSDGTVSPPVTVFAAPPQKTSGNGSWVLLAVAALLALVIAAAYYFNKERGKRDEDAAASQLEEREAKKGKIVQKKLV